VYRPLPLETHIRILCAYTKLHAGAEQALWEFAPDTEFVDVSKSDSAYFDLVREAWKCQETFLLVEHDIEIHKGVVESAKHCKQPWCVWPYMGHSQEEIWALGCVKFGRRLMLAQPTLMDEVGEIQSDCAIPKRHWKRLDARILVTLRAHGYAQPHVHESVKHHLFGV